jgi:hypothetical protein
MSIKKVHMPNLEKLLEKLEDVEYRKRVLEAEALIGPKESIDYINKFKERLSK